MNAKDSDHFNAQRPPKSEHNLNRLNLASPDPSLQVGTGAGASVSPGEIAGAISMSPPPLLETTRYTDRRTALTMLNALLWHKYTNDAGAGKTLYSYLLGSIASAVIVEEQDALKKPHLKAAVIEDIASNRGALTACCKLAIEDVCSPALFLAVSGREWARMLGLSHPMDWPRRWERRYRNIRRIVQELDSAIIEQAEKKV